MQKYMKKRSDGKLIYKDVSIQLIRILAMFSIILCHWVQEVNNPFVQKTAQFFNVGVYIFLFLSGWLYGKKKISDVGKWLGERVKRVLVPMWLFVIFLFVIYCFQGTMSWKYVPIYLTDTQYWFGSISGGAHLWFVSVIFLCYLITPLLNKIQEKLLAGIPLMILAGYLLCYFSHVGGMSILYTSVFVIGYFYRKKDIKIGWQLAVVIIVLALMLRVGSMVLLDGTILYDSLLVYVTHTALAIGVFVLGKKIFAFKSSKIINWFDDISYYVYITHCLFMIGPFRTMELTGSLPVDTIITLVLSFVSAVVLQKIHMLILEKTK